MFKKILFPLGIILVYSPAAFPTLNAKECAAHLGVARGGTLTLTRLEPTDVTALPAAALVRIIKSLKEYWVQITTRDPIPVVGNPSGFNTYLIKITGTGQKVRFRQDSMTVLGTSVDSFFPTTEIFLNDIISVQLIEVQELTIPLEGKSQI